MSAEWAVIVHDRERILEVRYPRFPTTASFELATKIAELNAWAVGNRMRKTARVIANSAIGELQGVRILKDGGVKKIGNLYKSRDEAWNALKSSI